ncbi:MAG: divergent polysaccharide deacetylase family protein [Pseudomonadota bacterium]
MRNADTDVVNSPPDAGSPVKPRRAGQVFVLAALLILGAAAAIYGWLAATHRLEDLTGQPPVIVVEIPDLAAPASPEEGSGAEAAAATAPTPRPDSAAPSSAPGAPAAGQEAAASTTTPPNAIEETGLDQAANAAPSTPTAPSPSATTEPAPPDAMPSEMTTASALETLIPPQKPEPPAPAGASTTAAAATAGGAVPEPAAPSASSASAPPTPSASTPAALPPAATQSAAATLSAPAAPEQPWRRYAASFPADDPRPRVALVVTGLGLSSAATQAAIRQLPPGVTLAFSPYAGNLQEWVLRARAAGHEVLVELPMEPMNYPADDPGPQALLSSLSATDNLQRLDWVLGRADGVAGVVANMGSRFASNPQLLRPVLARLAQRGFLYVDNRSSPASAVPEIAGEVDLPWAANTRFIDTEATRVAIDGRLQQLERAARETGAALALAQPYPVTIERAVAWAQSLEVKGLALAPVSALAKVGNR